MYLERLGTSKVVAWWRLACCYRQDLKEVGKILHHFIPLSRESLLKQHINIIICSIIFLFFHHGGFLGRVREIFFKTDKLETQIYILGPCWGHALKKRSRETCSNTTNPDLFSARNEGKDIIKKCTEISQIFNNITGMYQR